MHISIYVHPCLLPCTYQPPLLNNLFWNTKKKKSSSFPEEYPGLHHKDLRKSRGGGKKNCTRLFILPVWNPMHVIKNIIMYIIRKLSGWRASYQTRQLVQPLLSWQHGISCIMLSIFQWSRDGGKYSIICSSVPKTVHSSSQ